MREVERMVMIIWKFLVVLAQVIENSRQASASPNRHFTKKQSLDAPESKAPRS